MKIKYNLVFNRKKKLNKKGEALVQIECYQNSDTNKTLRKYISTGVYIKPDQWSKRHNCINEKHSNADELNKLLKNKIADLEDYELEQLRKKASFTLANFDKLSSADNTTSFTKFYYKELESLKPILARNTIKDQLNTYKKLIAFKENIEFSEVNFTFIDSFDKYLHFIGLNVNSRHKTHKNIRTYLNKAINKELFERDKMPYGKGKFQAKTEKTGRLILTFEEIETLERREFTEGNKHLEAIRDMFLFACYTGLRYSDLSKITWNNFHLDKQGLTMELKTQKVKKIAKFPLYLLYKDKKDMPSKPEAIILKYKDENFKKLPIFGGLSNQYVNRELKKIAELAGITKPVTCHVARHTFGTLAMMKKIPIATIKELMQHSDIKTTMIYQHWSNELIKAELEKVKW